MVVKLIYYLILLECEAVSNGLLKKGLRNNIIALAENARDEYTKFNGTNRTGQSNLNKSINDSINSPNSETTSIIFFYSNYYFNIF